MLGKRLRNERRNTCQYDCCVATRAHLKRTTKNERTREKQEWRKDAE